MTRQAFVFIGLGFVLAGSSGCKAKPAFAQVVHTTPVKQTFDVATEECEDVTVRRVRPVQDKNTIGGIVAGGLLGGALGNQLVSGRARGVATVAGAGVGAYAGSHIQKTMQKNDTYSATKTKCKVVMKPTEKVVAYDVKYLLDGQLASIRLESDPGPMLALVDGKVVLPPSAVATQK